MKIRNKNRNERIEEILDMKVILLFLERRCFEVTKSIPLLRVKCEIWLSSRLHICVAWQSWCACSSFLFLHTVYALNARSQTVMPSLDFTLFLVYHPCIVLVFTKQFSARRTFQRRKLSSCRCRLMHFSW